MNITIIIPTLNEEENIPILHSRLTGVLCGLSEVSDYELLFVNDGSTDGTLERIHSLGDPKARVISFPANVGKSMALHSAFQEAKYPWLVTMDADLQDDPRDIAKLLANKPLEPGCVVARRVSRSDTWVKRASTYIANLIHRAVLRDRFVDIVCPLKLVHVDCVRQIPYFSTMHRFLPVLIESQGFAVKEIDVVQGPRLHGRSKYNVLNRAFVTFCQLFYVHRLISKNHAALES